MTHIHAKGQGQRSNGSSLWSQTDSNTAAVAVAAAGFDGYRRPVGTNLIHEFTAVTFSVKLALFCEKGLVP